MSKPSCFNKSASFMTQNGEFSALTADQAITNFSAWTGLRTNISENIMSAMRIGFFISQLLQYSITAIFDSCSRTGTHRFCQHSQASLELRDRLSYGPS